ncbi:MAG: glycosyltransferase, partial [Bacteroidaceae bacterium]|nr:glycosyltransferase [Bacteroidaceae bacterium]
ICKNVELIPNGTFISDYQLKTPVRKHSELTGRKLIISVGGLEENKRHDLTIKAVAKLKDVDLLIVGRGQMESQLRELADSLIPGRCTIKAVPHEEIAALYHQADLFAMVSLIEAFGIVYIEAMASGLACVATDDEVRKEIIGEAGICCDAADIDSYANALRTALDKNWGDLPLKHVAQYDYSVIGEKYHQLIEKVMNEC